MSARRERKVVTVLFADLVGFTSRAESLDPEDVEAILRPYHERLRDELERFGGTVEKFIGDAVMALFGAPLAHEDDPERAVRAALDIRDWAEEEGELEVRIGITTGEALVSLDARPEGGQGMASGDVVNTAARLQAAAPVNGILVDETTYRATAQAIDYGESAPVEAKGKSEPVQVWEAVQAHAVVGVELRPQTPLVGRGRESGLLLDALERVKREASPQLVTVVGVPGIGKSRLVAELFAAVERDPNLIYWRQGRSLPYGEGVAFWAFAEMVKAQAGILHSDTEEVAAEKLHEMVTAAVEPDDVAWLEARLQPLIGLGEGADDLDESFAAWRRFVEELADRRPTVLVFEDLQWADDDLLDFVDYLVDWTAGVPLLVVGTARPELLDRRPGWGGGKRNAITISLAPLDDVETAQLIATLLDRPVLPAETQEALLERAGGNPLYAEQFARMLAERGNGVELPETVQGIIAARLDALSPVEKGLLQDASVIGKVFWTGALEAVSGVERREAERLLHGLERKEFVRRDRRSSVEGETEHAFAHLLVRDVAYSQIPRAARAERHGAAAEWIESLGRSEDRAELLAHHYLSALEFSQAAGLDTSGLSARAGTALGEAGDRALALNAFSAAQRFYGAALDLVPEGDRARPSLLYKWTQARAVDIPVDPDVLADSAAGFLAAGEREAAAEVEAYAANMYWNRGDRAAADRHLERAVELVQDAPLSPAKVRVLAERSRLSLGAGENEATIRVGREVLPLAEQLALDDVRAALLNNIGTSRVAIGDEGGFADLEQSLAIGLERSLPQHLHRTYHNLMESYRLLGRLDQAARVLADERRSDERFGLERHLLWVLAEEAVFGYLRGDWETALAGADELIGRAEAGAPHYMEVPCRIVRASIRLGRGHDSGANEDSQHAVELGREHKDPQALTPALICRALVLLALGRRDDASPLFEEALPLLVYYEALPDLAWLAMALGRTEDLLRRVEGFQPTPWREAALAIASGRIEQAADILAQMGALVHEANARLRSGRDDQVRRALEFYRSVGATRYIREGEALLAATA